MNNGYQYGRKILRYFAEVQLQIIDPKFSVQFAKFITLINKIIAMKATKELIPTKETIQKKKIMDAIEKLINRPTFRKGLIIQNDITLTRYLDKFYKNEYYKLI